jgi:hypothetical protein
MSHATELLHYIDAKYLSTELGGTNPVDVGNWINLQQHVDCFTVRATLIARRLATFVKVLNQEDISQLDNYDLIKEVNSCPLIILTVAHVVQLIKGHFPKSLFPSGPKSLNS